MASSWRWLLVVVALLVGAFAFACDGDDNGNGDEPTAEATVEDGDDDGNGDGDEDGDDDGNGNGDGDGGDAFEDVPLPDGASEEETLTISGSELPFFVPADSDVDAEAFGEITMKSYEVDSSPEDVIDFYEDNRGDWDEAFSLTIDEGGLLVWTKGDDRAVWISVGEGSDSDSTELIIIAGQAD